MKWYQSDYAKLAAIAIGSIVVFIVLTKYQLFSSEGYDALLPGGGLGGVPATNTLAFPTASQRVPALSSPASIAVTPAPGTRATGSPLVPVPVSGPGMSLADPVAVDDGLGIRGFAGTYADRPKDCFPKDQLNAEDLLPKDPYSQWAAVNPDGQGDLKDRNFLSAGFNRGIDTQAHKGVRMCILQLPMRLVELSRSLGRAEPLTTKVSDEDFNRVSVKTWYAEVGRNTSYAVGRIDGKNMRLHIFLLGKKPGFVIDHIDGDGLNNTRENLRHVTVAQNAQNSKPRIATSRFRGVSWCPGIAKWQTKCGRRHVGLYQHEIDAAKAYDARVLKVYGSDAATNFDLNSEEKQTILSDGDSEVLPVGVKSNNPDPGFSARIFWQGRRHNLGTFASGREAGAACMTKRKELTEAAIRQHIRDGVPIERNEAGVAQISIRNRKGEIVGIAHVDDQDWHRLSIVRWSVSDGYAVSTFQGEQTTMHRAVINLMGTVMQTGLLIDHLNRNRLDNRRQNLRLGTPSDNSQNRSLAKSNTSGFVGVERKKDHNRWISAIGKDYVTYSLGSHDHPFLAAVAYNIKAMELYERPFLNYIRGELVTDMARAVVLARMDVDGKRIIRGLDDVILSDGSTSRKRIDTDSKFKGVTKSCGKGKWNAEIGKDGVRHKLGVFDSEEAAALAYNAKAKELYLNPRLNVVTEADVPPEVQKTTSKHRGVSWSKKFGKWVGQFQHDKKPHYIGAFDDENEAARAVNKKMLELVGPNAKLNDVPALEAGDQPAPDVTTEGVGQRKIAGRGSSVYKGVSKTPNNTFAVEFRWKGQRYKGGTFPSELAAAKRYNELASEVTADSEEKPRLNVLESA